MQLRYGVESEDAMFKRSKKISVNIRVAAVLLLTVFINGCGSAKSKDLSNIGTDISKEDSEMDFGKIEEYRKYFENFKTVSEETVSDPDVESYKKEYWFLVADFMSGGFTTTQNLDYLNDDYPQEYYQYCLEDLNGDDIPEFLLGYGYNGKEPNEWEIYKTGNSYKQCFVGKTMCFDRERNALFDSYGDELNTYQFDGESLISKDSYYVNYDGCSEGEEVSPRYYYEDRDHNKKELSEKEYRRQIAEYTNKGYTGFDGKRLGIENLADDLGISRDSWAGERALRAYLGYLHYAIMNRNEMKNYRYSLAEIDGDGVPEMVAASDDFAEIWFYRNGRMLQKKIFDYSSGDTHYFSYYPGKNIIKLFSLDCGSSLEEYRTLHGELYEHPLVIRKTALKSEFSNDFLRDPEGNITYLYFANDEEVNEGECEKIIGAMKGVFDLGEDIRFTDMESYFYEDMMTYLEKETGYYQ